MLNFWFHYVTLLVSIVVGTDLVGQKKTKKWGAIFLLAGPDKSFVQTNMILRRLLRLLEREKTDRYLLSSSACSQVFMQLGIVS